MIGAWLFLVILVFFAVGSFYLANVEKKETKK